MNHATRSSFPPSDLLVHVDRTRLALVLANDTTFRRVLVLRRARDADGVFVERLRDTLLAHRPLRILASGFQPERDAHLAAALRRLAFRDDTPVVFIPNVRLLARQLRHRLPRPDDGESPAAPCPRVGPSTPPPPVAAGVPARTEPREPTPPIRPPYARPALAPA